jgi:hypothetical protein
LESFFLINNKDKKGDFSMSQFIQDLKRALFAFSLSVNPGMMNIMGSEYIRAVLNGEKDI